MMGTRGYCAIGLMRPKTPTNIGSALRAAGCYGAAMIAVQGARYHRSATDTQAAYRHIPLLHVEDMRASIPFDCVPVASELPKEMRVCRSARAVGDNTDAAWWYINPRTIDVMVTVNDGKGGPSYCGHATLTRKQLQTALAAMDLV